LDLQVQLEILEQLDHSDSKEPLDHQVRPSITH